MIAPGQLANIAVLSDDFLNVPDDRIQDITSVLTLLGGVPVHGAGVLAHLAPELPPPMPDWSPVRNFGGDQRRVQAGKRGTAFARLCACARACNLHGHAHAASWGAGVPVSDA